MKVERLFYWLGVAVAAALVVFGLVTIVKLIWYVVTL